MDKSTKLWYNLINKQKEINHMRTNTFTIELKKRFAIEFKKQDRSGVYGFTQCLMAYNSNKIEGSTLTEKQTASIFETGTLYADDTNTVFKTKDIEEMNGHFKMFNYTLQYLDEPLSEAIIKQMHRSLKEGVFEDLANGYAVGEYKKRANRVSDIVTALPSEVPDKMQALLQDYHAKEDITLRDIAIFHACFENIHPFQDGNGRVGRMILFKECLKHDIVPVIIRDRNKGEYVRHLNNAQQHRNFRGLLDYFQQEQDSYLNPTKELLFDYDQLEKQTEDILREIKENESY